MLPFAGLLLFVMGLLIWWAHGIDLAIHDALRWEVGGPWAPWLVRFSALGGFLVMGPVALIAVVWLTSRRAYAQAWWLAATIIVGRLVVEGAKMLVERPRPPVADRLEFVTSWSFPSSHSAGTMMTVTALALLAGGRRSAWLAAFAFAAAIGWSRVALGVHWPSDVLAGWGFGLCWAGLAWRYGGPIRSG